MLSNAYTVIVDKLAIRALCICATFVAFERKPTKKTTTTLSFFGVAFLLTSH